MSDEGEAVVDAVTAVAERLETERSHLTDLDSAIGDATMVDALVPAVHTFKKSIEVDDMTPVEALAKAVAAAERGVDFTVPIRASKGRASYLGWRSVGHQDPGATSTLYIMEELLDVATDRLDAAGDLPDDAESPTIPDGED